MSGTWRTRKRSRPSAPRFSRHAAITPVPWAGIKEINNDIRNRFTVHEEGLKHAVEVARKRNIVIPTFKQMKDPETHTPASVKEKLKKTGLWDVDSANLFRITWKNQPVKSGGLFGGVNYIELPSALTGVDARIVAIVGKWFPTGAHKVGASFGCLAPRLVTGQFDPLHQKAVWPSTETTAGAAPTTPSSWAANPSPSFPRA